MTEQDLIDLGFTKEYGDDGWYYYTYNFANGFSLITNASDKLLDSQWYAEVFELKEIRFTDKKELKKFINIVKRNSDE